MRGVTKSPLVLKRRHPAGESCLSCDFSRLCLPVGLGDEDIERLDDIIAGRRCLKADEYLYRSNDPFHALYAIRSGTVKSYLLKADGSEQIIGFYLPGELLGLDGIGGARHRVATVALETTLVCEIPFAQLEVLAAQVPRLQHQLLRIMSEEISSDQELLHAFGRRGADARLALALLHLAQRYERRGLSSRFFHLPMARSELANFLGITPETISRLFHSFVERRWIDVRNRELTLRDPDALRRVGNS